MRITGKHLARVAKKLGYTIREGKKHTLVLGSQGLITTLPRGKIKPGTLANILKRLGITRTELERLL